MRKISGWPAGVVIIASMAALIALGCRTPRLHQAILDNDVRLLESALLDGEVGSAWTPCAPVPYKRTWPIHLACDLNRIECVRILAEHGCELDAVDGYGRTPLMISCDKSTGAIKLLVRHGASLEIADRMGRTALQRAISTDAFDAADLLLSLGASGKHKNGEITRFHVLAMRANDGQIDAARSLVEELLDQGVDPSAGKSAADIAESRGNSRVAELLRSLTSR